MHYLKARSLKTGISIVFLSWATIAHAATVTLLTQVNGNQANNASYNPSISGDGRYVVFESDADNLVIDDTNQVSDIFLIDTQDGSITRVSVDAIGGNANDASSNPVISNDGRYVAFESFATNLVTADTNLAADIFLFNTTDGTTQRVSIDSNGVQANSHSFGPTLSANGETIAFYSLARNLAASDTNRSIDVFVHNIVDSSTQRISVDSNGVQANMDSWQPTINATGQYVVFSSNATNLDTNDTNSVQDIFLHDIQSGETSLISHTYDNQPGNEASSRAVISGDGQVIAFESLATNLVANDINGSSDIFVFDRSQNVLTRVSTAADGSDSDGPAYQAGISQDGRFVSYYSYASNITDNDTNNVEDVFIFDLRNGSNELLTMSSTSQASNGSSYNSILNNDGRYVVIASTANNLVDTDANNTTDLFLYDRGIINEAPIANAGNDINVVLGNTVNVDGSGSFDPDGNTLQSYLWQIVSAPVGSSLANWTASQMASNFTPDVAGVYVISLIVNDGITNSNPDEIFITVSNNLPPTASIATSIQEGYAPLVVYFDGSASSDPEMDTLDLLWDFGNGNTSSETSPSFSFLSPGLYPVILTVTDALGNQDQAIVNINVLAQNQAPQIQSLSITPTNGSAPLLVDFTLQVSDPDNDMLTIVWDLGDNQRIENTLAFSHVYTNPGDFTGTVTVSDGINIVSQEFLVSVDSSFHIKDVRLSIYVNNRKSSYGKVSLWSQFELANMPDENDSFTIKFGSLEIADLKFRDLVAVKPGVYTYKSFGLYIKMDFNRNNINVIRKHLTAFEKDIESAAGLMIRLGYQQASISPDLYKSSVCRKRDRENRRYADGNSDDSQADCYITRFKNR